MLKQIHGKMNPRKNNRISLLWTDNLQHIFLKIFLVLLSISSSWIIYASYDQSKAINHFSDGYVWQLNTSIKDSTRNYLLPAKNIAKLGSYMFSEGLVSLDAPTTLSTFISPFVDSYPQLNSYYVGTEENVFWFWGKEYSKEHSYSIQRVEKNVQGVLIEYVQYLDVENKILSESVSDPAKFLPTTRSWYKGAKELGDGFWSDIYFFNGIQDWSNIGITASYPIYDNTGRLLGVWGVDIVLKELSEFLSDISSSRKADSVIFNEQGNIIAYSGFDQVPFKNKLLSLSDLDNAVIQKALASYQKHGFSEFFFKVNGSRYLASYSPFLFGEEKDWHLLVVLSENQFIKNIGINFYLVIIFAAIVLLISVTCLILLFRLPRFSINNKASIE